MASNFGDILDAIEPVVPPERPAFIHGDRTVAWHEAAAMSNRLARAMIARGAQPLDKLAIIMRNRPEYGITLAAALKARMTQVNVNYRYTAREVWYILDNADAQTVVYASEFRNIVAEVRSRLPHVANWIEVADDGDRSPTAEDFNRLACEGDGTPLGIERSGDDQFFIYTGGTTGMPKGVVWTHGAIREIILLAARQLGSAPETLEEVVAATAAMPGPRVLVAPPMMHATGLLTTVNAHLAGGCVITLEGATFDAAEMLAAIDRHRPTHLVMVGDSFGRPLLDALDREPGRFRVDSVAHIQSSGVMWSAEVKRGLLRHMPKAILVDSYASSEAMGQAASLTTLDGEVPTARFSLSSRCRVFDENDEPVEPGSTRPGLIAVAEPNPLGYYKDEAKSAEIFRTIQGARYAVPGDWCMVEADGSLTLLGRGSACINTAGEKVFPEEVEEVLKQAPSVADALVIGLADPKWGQSITAVVALREGERLDERELRAHVREHLAGFKVPKRVVVADRPLRLNNGKPDYPAARAAAERALASAHEQA